MLYFRTFFEFPLRMTLSLWGMNSVDLLMVLVVAAGVYTGRNDSIVAALIKAFGVVCTIFITFHYYVRFANFLRSAFLGRDAECEFFAFSLIFTIVFLVFILISKGWAIIIKIQALEPIDRWGSMLLSVARGYFLCGMIVFALILANHRYASPKARMSVSFLLMGES